MINERKPLTEKEELIVILQARINDYRAVETFFKRFGVKMDQKRTANIIGALRRVIAYIERQ